MNLISIITVCKNSETEIEKTIQSIVNQKFDDFEYIIIDGNSTDNTRLIIQKYRNRITKYLSENDKNLYDAMNKGICLANGKYLLFINSGDYLINNEVLQKFSDLQTDEDIVFGKIIKEGFKVDPKWMEKINLLYLFRTDPPHQASFIKKTLFERYGPYNDSFLVSADYDFFLRTLVKNKCTFRQNDLIVSYFKQAGYSKMPGLQKIGIADRKRSRVENFRFKHYLIFSIIFMFIKLLKILIIRPTKYLISFLKTF